MSNHAQSRRIAQMIAGGAGLLFIGLLLPWVSVSFSLGSQSASLSRSGLSTGDGKIVLVMAILLGLLAVPYFSGKVSKATAAGVITLILSALATLICFVDIADISNRVTGAPSGLKAGVGFGLSISTLGGVVSLVAAIMALRARKRLQPADAPAPEGGIAPPSPPGEPVDDLPGPPPTPPTPPAS